jgi:hypothetical protein
MRVPSYDELWRRSHGASHEKIMREEELDKNLNEPGSEHDRVWSNLPWFVNQTLSADEQREAAAHLSSCLTCRRELAGLRTLQNVVAARTLEPRREAALDRLHERMNENTESRRIFPWAAAAVLAIVTGLTALVALNTGLIGSSGGTSAFITLGSRTITMVDDNVASARIVFDQDMTELQLRKLLLAVDAELIDGPTPRGAYTIAFPEIDSSTGMHSAVAVLRESKRVIFVEPIVSIGGSGRED